jgi:hypothetical protein
LKIDFPLVMRFPFVFLIFVSELISGAVRATECGGGFELFSCHISLPGCVPARGLSGQRSLRLCPGVIGVNPSRKVREVAKKLLRRTPAKRNGQVSLPEA